MTTAVEAEIEAMVAEAFDDTIPRKRAVLRVASIGAMAAATGEAAVTSTDQECWALLDSSGLRGGSVQSSTSIEHKGRVPWLLQGLSRQPRGGDQLVIEGVGTGIVATFTHGGAARTGSAYVINTDGQDQSAGVGALWKVLA